MEQLANKLLVIVFVLLFLIAIAFAIARATLIADDTGYANLSWVWPMTRSDDLQEAFTHLAEANEFYKGFRIN